MNKAKRDIYHDDVMQYDKLTDRINNIKDFIEHQKKQDGKKFPPDMTLTSAWESVSGISKDLVFKDNHPIVQRIMKMLDDEIIKLEKERDEL